MQHIQASFSGFSVNDQAVAKAFYQDTLGFKIVDETMALDIELPGGSRLFVYPKPDHQPATFTVLNFVVDDIDASMEELQAKGISFEHYDDLGGGAKPDEKGILRGLKANMGPDIAWFKDPAGNILSILQTK